MPGRIGTVLLWFGLEAGGFFGMSMQFSFLSRLLAQDVNFSPNTLSFSVKTDGLPQLYPCAFQKRHGYWCRSLRSRPTALGSRLCSGTIRAEAALKASLQRDGGIPFSLVFLFSDFALPFLFLQLIF